MEFYDFFPGLSKSQEAYFGRSAPLATTLLTYSEKLINFFKENNYKDKSFYLNLSKITEAFGNEIAKDVNAEKCQVIVSTDIEVNAFAALMFGFGDTCYEEKNEDGSKFVGVDFDKIADIEDIIITQNGYQFRNSKNKILFVNLNYGLFLPQNNLTPETIAALTCHEIGHSFQQGIFGLYKNIADICIASVVNNKKNQFNNMIPKWLPSPIRAVLKATFAQRLFIALMSYLWFPNLLTNGLFAKFGAWLEKFGWGKKVENPQYLMRDKLQKWDDSDKKTENELKNSLSSRIIHNTVIYTSQQKNNISRNDYYVKQMSENNEKAWKNAKKEGIVTEDDKTTTSNFLINFFKSIVTDVHMIDDNVIDVIALNNYTVNQYSKITFYKRYEFFADVFATSYGFGADLFNSLNKIDEVNLKNVDKDLIIGINKIPFFKSIAKTNFYILLNKNRKVDVHGTRNERSVNMYTALVHELQSNASLTSDQKKAIQHDIDLINEADEQYYKDMKESGFWFKYYNKLIDERIKGKVSKDTIEEVLKPIEEICKETMKK